MLCEIVAGSYNIVVEIVISAEELGIFSKLWKKTVTFFRDSRL